MPKFKALLAFLFFIVLYGCSKTPQPRVAVKLYDSQKHLLFSSLGIEWIVIHERSKTAEFKFSNGNWSTVQNLDLNNKLIDVYINDYFIQQATILTPLKTNAIHLTNIDENNLNHVINAVGINTDTESD